MGKDYGVADYLLSKTHGVFMALRATPPLTPTLSVGVGARREAQLEKFRSWSYPVGGL